MTATRVTCVRCGSIGTEKEIAAPHSHPLAATPELCHEGRWFVEGKAQ